MDFLDSGALDVAIGITLVYVLMASVCSIAQEAFVARLIATRAGTLESGMKLLLEGPAGGGETWALLRKHPLIAANERRWLGLWGDLRPSYISPRAFSMAVMDIMDGEAKKSADCTAYTSPIGSEVSRAYALFKAEAPTDGELRANLERWFDDAMDRLSGIYKRRTQLWLFVIGLAIAFAMNVETFAIAKSLQNDAGTRSILVAEAEEIIATGAPVDSGRSLDSTREDLGKLGLPIGEWTKPDDTAGWFARISGIAITAGAAAMGAPFWFDLLKALMRLRSGGVPAEPGRQPAMPGG